MRRPLASCILALLLAMTGLQPAAVRGARADEEPTAAEREELESLARRQQDEAQAHYEAGRLEQAVQGLERALGTLQRLHGEGDHSEVAVVLADLAACLGMLRRHAEGLPLLQQALAMQRRLHEGDHPDVAGCLNGMADCLAGLGRHGDALPVYRDALAMRQRLFEGDHPDVAFSHARLAVCLTTLGKREEALPHFRASLDMRRRRHDGDHAEIAESLTFLALCVRDLGRAVRARPLFEEALAMRRRLHGDDHPLVAQALNNLALCLQGLGRSDEALPLYREALAMIRRGTEGDHHGVAATLTNVATCLVYLGRPVEALPFHRDALAMKRRLYAGDHPGVVHSLNALASCLEAIGNAQEALPLYRQGLAMGRRLFPGNHPLVARCLNNTATCLRVLGRHEQTLTLHQEALAMRRGLFRQDHPHLAASLNNVALALKDLGRPADALPLMRRSLAMCRRLHAGDHPAIATTLGSLASGLVAVGRYTEALPLYEDALAMQRRIYEGDHPHVALGFNNVAGCLLRLDRSAEAVPLYRRALDMRTRLHPGEHPQLATSLSNLANCLAREGRGAEALPLHRRALAMREQLYGGDHPQVAASLSDVGLCLQEAGRPEEALPLLRRAVEMSRRTGWSQRGVVAQNLAMLLLAEGGADGEAIALLDEAIEHIETLRARATGLGAQDRATFFRHLRGRQDPYQVMVRAQVRRGQPALALQYLERSRSRALLDLLQRSRSDPVARAMRRAQEQGDEALRARLQRVLEALGAAEQRASEATHAVALARERRDLDAAARRALVESESAALVAARRTLQGVLTERAALLRDVIPLARPAGAGGIRARLAPGERMLIYSVGERDSVLLAVGPPGETLSAVPLRWPEEDRPVLAQDLGATVGAYLDGLGVQEGVARGRLQAAGERPAPDRERVAHLGRRLFRALLPDAVWKEVRRAPRVYLVPHGPLHRLPFEALRVAEDGEGRPTYVLDVAPPIGYVPSGSTWLWCRERRDAQLRRGTTALEVVALGDPVYGRGNDPAPAWPEQGALILGAEAGGRGARAGLMVGDVIARYAGREIADHKDLRAALRHVADAIEDGTRQPGAVRVAVWRRGQRQETDVEPGALGIEVARTAPAVAARDLDAGATPDVVTRGAASTIADSLAPLPGTRREVDAIAQAFGESGGPAQSGQVAALLGPEATEQRLFALAPRARYLHLGTHGLVDERDEASYSALALTLPPFATPRDDGFLTLHDLFEHWRDRLSGCELAVLSACRTQRGPLSRDEGVFALSWGLHYAGCPSVIASLWSVSDKSTALLMGDFYARLAAGPKGSKLEAFTAARKALRKTHPEPFHWAPFVYVGDPR